MKLELTLLTFLTLFFFTGLAINTVFGVGRLQVTDLGTLGGTESSAIAINDNGRVLGASHVAGRDRENHFFLYDSGLLADVSLLYNIGSGYYATSLIDINNKDHIVGNISNGDAVLLSQGVITDLDRLGGSYSSALGINNSGQSVGYYASSYGFHHALLYSNGTIKELGPFGAEAISVATAINDSGMVVGMATDSYRLPSHAFLYSNGFMKDIRPFGSSESYARGINKGGQVVGEFLTADGAAFHAFLYSNGLATDLGSAGSPESVAYAINDYGQVVGTTWVPYDDVCPEVSTTESTQCINYKPHAFLYENGRLIDLNTLIQPESGWELTSAVDINNKGQIVGSGLVNGKVRAFLLTGATN
ncbi:MAG: hypothetical protein ABJB22_00120 [Verrucomicrobiota bacterium]